GWRNGFSIQLVELGFHLLVTQTERRSPAAVDSVKFVFFCAVNDCEQIAAHAVRDRLHQTERRVRGDRSVHCAATAFQNIKPDLRRRRYAGANHSVPCENFGSRRATFSRDPIDWPRSKMTN